MAVGRFKQWPRLCGERREMMRLFADSAWGRVRRGARLVEWQFEDMIRAGDKSSNTGEEEGSGGVCLSDQ